MADRPRCIGHHRPRRLADGGRARAPRARWRITQRHPSPYSRPEQLLYCGTHANGFIRAIAKDQAAGREPFWTAEPV